MQTTIPLKARVLFPFQATKPGEMPLVQGEIVDVLIRGPPSGWCKGIRGAFPTDYVEFLPPPPPTFGQTPVFGSGNMTPSNNLSNTFTAGSGMMMNNSNNNMFPGQQPPPVGNMLLDSMLPSIDTRGGGEGLLDLNWGMSQPSAINSMYKNTNSSSAMTASLLDMDMPTATGGGGGGGGKGGGSLDLLQMDNLLAASDRQKTASVKQLLDLDGSLAMGGPVDILQPQRLTTPATNMTVNTIHKRQDESGKINLSLSKSAIPAADNNDSLLSFELPSPGKLMVQVGGNGKTSSIDPFSDFPSSSVSSSNLAPLPFSATNNSTVTTAAAVVVSASTAGTGLSSKASNLSMLSSAFDNIMGQPTAMSSPPSSSSSSFSLTSSSMTSAPVIRTTEHSGGDHVRAAVPAPAVPKPFVPKQPLNFESMVQSITRVVEKSASQLGAGRSGGKTVPDKFTLSAIGAGPNMPLWRHQLFSDLFLDMQINSGTEASTSSDSEQRPSCVRRMGLALRMICASLQHVRDTQKAAGGDSGLRSDHNHINNVMLHAIRLFDDGSKMCDKMPRSSSDSEGFFMFLATFMARIRVLRENESVIAPCTWISSDDQGKSEHGVFIVLTKTNEETSNNYSIAVVNTGDGDGSLGYHGTAVDATEGLILRNTAFQFCSIPNNRIENTAFWFLLFKSTIQPSPKFGSKFLYEKVIPFLTSMPVLTSLKMSLDAGNTVNDFRHVPQGRDHSFITCAVEALRYVGRAAGLDPTQANHLTMNVSSGMLGYSLNDLQIIQSIDSSEVDILRMACRSLARSAAGLVDLKAQQYSMVGDLANSTVTLSQLAAVKDTIASVESKIAELDERKLPSPAFNLSSDETLEQFICEWPHFGRMRRDVDVESLAGKAPIVPIIRPIEMTLVPDGVTNFSELATAMYHTMHLTVLLANQQAVVRNSFTLRVCLIQHLFTRVIPLPLPLSHPDRDQHCFWHAQPIRHETQADILRILNLLSKHFATASLSVKSTRSGDAVRMLTFACMATVCDAALRKLASDIPAIVSLHYSGRALGPVHPFAFDLGNFEEVTLLHPTLTHDYTDPNCQ